MICQRMYRVTNVDIPLSGEYTIIRVHNYSQQQVMSDQKRHLFRPKTIGLTLTVTQKRKCFGPIGAQKFMDVSEAIRIIS